ncbi:M56 family metallopeptidase [Alteromonas sp. ASW11-130]|uniref:M56 family metallopeptidase n=1 Tax=Alteromonas sp. ASW11-130 TaxID=3015775 RepID=UPI002242254F|nr:M56 family metallopeptidase [Alteromonas sp. ASW11-130]MCW8092730.1 ankyrin repeat domain-containing protein [Alteromonas sp. ASW11-130]
MIAESTVLLTLGVYHLGIGSVLIVLLLLVSKLFELSAETKSWLWLTAFLLAILLPFTSLSISSKPQQNPTLQGYESKLEADPGAFSAGLPQLSDDTNWHLPAELAYSLSNAILLLGALWLVGILWRACQVGRAYVRAIRLKKSASPTSIEKFNDIPVVCSPNASSPMAIGIFNPVIVLPDKFIKHMVSQQLMPILLHEKAHIQRGDLWVGALQEVLALIFWWSPVVRSLNHKIHIYRELSCDIRAVRNLKNSKHYAQSLVDSAKLMLSTQENILSMGLFSKKKDLAYRVTSVLEHKAAKQTRLYSIVAGCLTLCVTTGLAVINLIPEVNAADVARDAKQFARLDNGESQTLIHAVAQNDEELVEFLINRGTDINVPLTGDGTALMIATRQNNINMVKALIRMGADVDQPSYGDGNPLIIAAKRNHQQIAKLLLNNGANVNALVKGDETPLIQASWKGHEEMVKLLVEHGADVNLGVFANKFTQREWRSPLSKANTQEIKSYLIRQGAKT